MQEKQLTELLFDRYGAILDLTDLAKVMRMQIGTVKNKLSEGTFPIRTYKLGRRRVADVRDVAGYLDRQRDEA